MKSLVLFWMLSLPALPALAQDTVPTVPAEEGFSLMDQGARLLLRGLMREMAPTIDSLSKTVTELEPALRDLAALVDDIRNYSAPEMLENGDILIRRKQPGSAPLPDRLPGPLPGPLPDPVPGPNGEIEL